MSTANFDEIALQLDYAGEMYSGETAQVEWANKVDGLWKRIWWLRNAGGTAEQVQEVSLVYSHLKCIRGIIRNKCVSELVYSYLIFVRVTHNPCPI